MITPIVDEKTPKKMDGGREWARSHRMWWEDSTVVMGRAKMLKKVMPRIDAKE